MTVTKTNITISLTQPNSVSLDCWVFRMPFWMALQSIKHTFIHRKHSNAPFRGKSGRQQQTMAAALNAVNNYMEHVLLISTLAARQAINVQGMEALDELMTLMEEDISNICSNVRKPGGVLPNPMHDLQNVVAGIPLKILNPGVNVGHVHEKWLKALWYYTYHIMHIQCPFTVASVTLVQITALYQHKEQEDEYSNEIMLPEKLASVDNIRMALEDLDEYLL